jgi:surface polysaccharide O-acyltransferase-like enzyme
MVIVTCVTDDDHQARAVASVPPVSPDLSGRDLTVDFVRVFCVLLVVVIHLLEVGIGTSASGAITVTRPLEHEPWFNGVTWAGQIMPLFFVVGGFASMTAWRRLKSRGGDAADFVRTRVLRLALPALPLFLFYVVAIGGALLAGVDPAFLQTITTGAGSPLWFVAAYTLVQALVPVMARLHERAPKSTLLVLLLVAILVDVVRYSTNQGNWGLANLAFIWLFCQQIGFWYADGWFARRAWWQLVLIAAACYALLEPLTTIGPYSPNLLVDLNPPCLPLAVVAVAQACVLQLLKPALARLMQTRGARAVVFLAGSRLMTIYLWHLPLIIALSGLALVIPGATPNPGSAAWWWTRPLFYVIVLAALYGISFPLRWFERPRPLGPAPRDAVVFACAVLTFIPAFAVLEWFLDFEYAVLGAVCLTIVALMLNRSPVPKRIAMSVE